MPEALPTLETDFSAQMQALVIEAASARGDKSAPVENPKPSERRLPEDRRVADERRALDERRVAEERRALEERLAAAAQQAAFEHSLRPVLIGMQALMRAQNAQAQTLERLEQALGNYSAVPAALGDAKVAMEQRNVVNRAMFEALHGELKGYKDDFIRETAVRPVVRDLISLYDDTLEIQRQVAAAAPNLAAGSSHPLAQLSKNLAHHISFILEVLERMEVRPVAPQGGLLDKRTQKVVAREPARSEAEDFQIVRSVRPGFLWRDKPVRPEEVVIRKWGLASPVAGDGDAASS